MSDNGQLAVDGDQLMSDTDRLISDADQLETADGQFMSGDDEWMSSSDQSVLMTSLFEPSRETDRTLEPLSRLGLAPLVQLDLGGAKTTIR